MSERAQPDGPVQDDIALARLGVEIWRLGVRLQTNRADRLEDSFERLMQIFADLGGRIDDQVGQPFVEGTTAEILNQPEGVDPGAGSLVWAETVRPGVYLGDRCLLPPQVMLALREDKPR